MDLYLNQNISEEELKKNKQEYGYEYMSARSSPNHFLIGDNVPPIVHQAPKMDIFMNLPTVPLDEKAIPKYDEYIDQWDALYNLPYEQQFSYATEQYGFGELDYKDLIANMNVFGESKLEDIENLNDYRKFIIEEEEGFDKTKYQFRGNIYTRKNFEEFLKEEGLEDDIDRLLRICEIKEAKISHMFNDTVYSENVSAMFKKAESRNPSHEFLDMMGGYNQLKAVIQDGEEWIKDPDNMMMIVRFEKSVNAYCKKAEGRKFTSSGKERRDTANVMRHNLEVYIHSLSKETYEQYLNMKRKPDHEVVLKYTPESIEKHIKTSKTKEDATTSHALYENEAMFEKYDEYQKLYKDILNLSKNKHLKKLLAAGDAYQDYAHLFDINNSLNESDRTYLMFLNEWMNHPEKYGMEEEAREPGDITLGDIRALNENYNHLRIVQHAHLFTKKILEKNIEKIISDKNIPKKQREYIQSIYIKAQELFNVESFDNLLEENLNSAYSDISRIVGKSGYDNDQNESKDAIEYTQKDIKNLTHEQVENTKEGYLKLDVLYPKIFHKTKIKYQRLYRDICNLSKNKHLRNALKAAGMYQDMAQFLDINKSIDEVDHEYCEYLKTWDGFGTMSDDNYKSRTLYNADARLAYQSYSFARMQKFATRFMSKVLTPETIAKLRSEHLLSDSVLKQIKNMQDRADILFDNDYHRELIDYNMSEARKQIMKAGHIMQINTTTKLDEYYEDNGRHVCSREEISNYGNKLDIDMSTASLEDQIFYYGEEIDLTE